jgi:hypothetical protein
MIRTHSLVATLVVAVSVVLMSVASPTAAQTKQPAGSMSKEQQAMMDAMMKAMRPGENHKLLASLVGEWTFVNRMWMDPAAPHTESTGTATYMTIMGGRYLQGEHKGVMAGMPFEGLGVTGYDNVGKQFVASWIDNFGTGIMYMTGKFAPATKTFTYTTVMDDPMKPGTKLRVRQVIRLVDRDKHVMEWYETRGGKDRKTMEIVYARKK